MAKFRESGFAKVRRGILEHLQDGKISLGEFSVYMLILLNADPATGVWQGSARQLAQWYLMPERTCRDNMEKLEHKGYIKRFHVPGKHASYPILINRFEVTDGAAKGSRLNADESLSYSTLIYDRCRDGAVDSAVDGADVKENKRTKEKNKDLPRAVRTVDPRHTIFRNALERYWRHVNAGTTLPELPWDARTAKALSELLSASPTLDVGAFLKMLNYRSKSDVNQAERTYVWLRKVTDYAGGPLDRFGKPLGGNHATRGINRSQARTDSNIANARTALAEMLGVDGDVGGSAPGEPEQRGVEVYALCLAQYNPAHVEAVLTRLGRTQRAEFEKAIPELGDLEAMVKQEAKKAEIAKRGPFVSCGKCCHGIVFVNDKGQPWKDSIDFRVSEQFARNCECKKAWLAGAA